MDKFGRPSWKEYFLTLAFVVSSRSLDAETKHGCVITDFSHFILGTGYNSTIRGINDDLVPKIRPEKYPYFLHSEVNCLLNCIISPRQSKNGARAYVTGQCCNECTRALIQAGVNEIYIANRKGIRYGSAILDENSQKIFDFLVKESHTYVEYVDMDLNWVMEFINQCNK